MDVPPSTLRFYSITQGSCRALGSLWEMLDSNPGPLPQKSGALPMSHHISMSHYISGPKLIGFTTLYYRYWGGDPECALVKGQMHMYVHCTVRPIGCLKYRYTENPVRPLATLGCCTVFGWCRWGTWAEYTAVSPDILGKASLATGSSHHLRCGFEPGKPFIPLPLSQLSLFPEFLWGKNKLKIHPTHYVQS